MAVHFFCLTLLNLRKTSQWPEAPDFANRVGLSAGGYRKYEIGERLPSSEALERIIRYGMFPEEGAKKLRAEWTHAKAQQAGIGPLMGARKEVDIDKLAVQLHNEVLFILKSERLAPDEQTRRVLLSRMTMLLKAALE